MRAAYGTDIISWANEQASLLRAGKFSQVGIEHIADEVKDVGNRELAGRMGVLLARLLKREAQPERRGRSSQGTVREQRNVILRRLARTPSLKASLSDPEWFADAWSDARAKAFKGTTIKDFPETRAWTVDQMLDSDFVPG